MKCPVCENTLQPVQAGAVTVDACHGGCGGLWFDHFELTKVDEPHESGADLLVEVNVNSGVPVDPARKRRCPKCGDVVMMRHFFSAKRTVEVDECGNCGGYWLDAGELALIREEYQGEMEKKLAVEKFLSESSAGELTKMRLTGEFEARRASKIGNLFRFTCPIRYRVSPGAGA